MTKVERLSEEEKEQAVMEAEQKVRKEAEKKAREEKKTIANRLLISGDTVEKVIQCTGLSPRMVRSFAEKL